jgi:hypothetical protein
LLLCAAACCCCDQDDEKGGKGHPGVAVHEVKDDTVAKEAGVEVRHIVTYLCA